MHKLSLFALVTIVLSVFALGLLFVLGQKKPGVEPAKENVLSESASPGVVWRKVNTDTLTLIPNFREKKTSKMVFEQYGCSLVVSGGFYSLEGEAIGYFVTDGQEISPFRENKLFNGILSINSLNTPRIVRGPAEGDRIALQTGPVLIENGAKTELKLIRDASKRRTVAAITGSNELIFINFHSPGSVYSGPFLAQLADEVFRLSEDENLNIADAINLDGGSASAFVTSGANLVEASPVGSFFCAR